MKQPSTTVQTLAKVQNMPNVTLIPYMLLLGQWVDLQSGAEM